MLFKQRKINKLKIEISGLNAASALTACYVEGDTNSYFVDKHERNIKALAEAKAKLSILESK